MKRIDISDEELETMNYNDIAYEILKVNDKPMKIADLFKEVCNLLKLSDDDYQSHIGDFFELLSTDKRFIMLDKGYWDLKIKYSKGMEADEDDEDDEDIILDEDDEDTYEKDDNGDDTLDDDTSDDDLKDLIIIDDNEEESN